MITKKEKRELFRLLRKISWNASAMRLDYELRQIEHLEQNNKIKTTEKIHLCYRCNSRVLSDLDIRLDNSSCCYDTLRTYHGINIERVWTSDCKYPHGHKAYDCATCDGVLVCNDGCPHEHTAQTIEDKNMNFGDYSISDINSGIERKEIPDYLSPGDE